MNRGRWALFLSGRGSTAQAVLDNCAQLNIQLIVSSKKQNWGRARARRFGVSSIHFDKNMSWDDLHQNLKKEKIDRLFLLGFMKLIPENFIEKWQNKILNVHPSLLPKYPGLEAMEKSYHDQADMGVTIHRVTAEMDSGPVVAQKLKLKKTELPLLNFEQTQIRMSFCEQELVRRASEMEKFL